MLIVCPNCATSYDVDVASLRPDGRKVRCVRCRTIWHAELSHADKLIAAAEELAPVRRTVEAVAAAAAEGAVSRSELEQREAATAEADAIAAAFGAPVEGVAFDAAEFEPPADDPAAAAAESADDAPAPEAPEMDSPPIAPVDLDVDAPPIEVEATHDRPAGPRGDVESVAWRRPQRRPKRALWARWSLTRLQTATLALIVIDAIGVGWRADLVRILPQTASFYASIGLPVNLRGLSFDSVVTSTEQHEGVPILVVEGNIINETRKMANVPHLRFAVRNAAHQEIYSWTAVPPRPMLPPGEGVAFRARLASPPPDVHDVLVRFLNRYDVMNGTR
jgi:predicted Zn finger-like uncharacterized protein